MQKHAVLIAVVGTSPAVLTETVWALAHWKKPVVPDEIVVVTTKAGKAKLRAELQDGGVWAEMKAALARAYVEGAESLRLGETSIRVLPDAEGNEIDDLRSADDNLRAADFMLGVVRQYTEDPGTVVYASIAGGRKTMSALLLSCMSLLGREEDKVFHVLTMPEALALAPAFFYPRRGEKHVFREEGRERMVRSEKVQVDLFEVPFVRMRGWYREKFRSLPPSYRALVAKVQTAAPPALAFPFLEIDARTGAVKLDGRPVALSGTCFAALLLLAEGCAPGDLHARLLQLHAGRGVTRCDWLDTFREGSRFARQESTEDLTKVLSELRGKLQEAGLDDPRTLVPMRCRPVTFPLSRINLRNKAWFADVRGCPESDRRS